MIRSFLVLVILWDENVFGLKLDKIEFRYINYVIYIKIIVRRIY